MYKYVVLSAGTKEVPSALCLVSHIPRRFQASWNILWIALGSTFWTRLWTRRRANYSARGGGVAEGTSSGKNATKNIVLFAKNRYTWSLWCQKQVHTKTKYKSHARSPAIGQRHIVLRLASVISYLFLAWIGQVHLVLSTLSSFQPFLANFEPIRGHTLVPRHVSYNVS